MSELLTWLKDPERQRELREAEQAEHGRTARNDIASAADDGERLDARLRSMVADSVDRLDTRGIKSQEQWNEHLAGTFRRGEEAAGHARMQKEHDEIMGKPKPPLLGPQLQASYSHGGREAPRGDEAEDGSPRYDGEPGDKRTFAAWQQSLFGKKWGNQ